MSGISNRLYISTLEDGTTLHANLASDISITQAWTGITSTPDWTNPANQPTIYLTLMAGNSVVLPESGFKWLYNGAEIDFTDQNCKFQQTTYKLTYDHADYYMPAIKIVDNLAVSDNVDIDTITFEGSYGAGGAGIAFACQTQIRLSRMNGSGYIGVINFTNGISDITQKNQTITMQGIVYDGKTGNAVPGYQTRWTLNDGTPTSYSSSSTYQVTEANVVDHATVKCDFQDSAGNYLTTAYAGIDDMQDPEYMYIQYNGANGNAASLRKGDTAPFQIWVGTRDDSGVLGIVNGVGTAVYQFIYVKVLDSDGNVATGAIGGIPDVKKPALTSEQIGYGYRQLNVSGGKGSINPTYDAVFALGKNMTGIVMAYEQEPDWAKTNS